MDNKKLKNERRKFFGLLGKGVLGVSLISALPFNLFGKNSSANQLKDIKVHPKAVKRSK